MTRFLPAIGTTVLAAIGLAFAVGTVLAVVLASQPSAAETVEVACARFDVVSAKLRSEFGEAPAVMGVTGGGSVLVVFAAPAGSWTGVLLRPDGVACIVGAGSAFESLPAAAKGRRS